MSHTEHHLEHAEHAQHAAHDPLDRKVAMTMAIIAAILAAAAMISHRGHTEVLRLSNQANLHHTKASDAWNYYQAKNTLSRQYKVLLMEAQSEKTREYLTKEIEKYEGTRDKKGSLAKLEHNARELTEQGEEEEHASHGVHQSVNWIDFGHLGLELALVLCSITVLTKQRGFWYVGMAAAAAGVVVVLVGVVGLLEHGHI
jgi:hypothetical protein